MSSMMGFSMIQRKLVFESADIYDYKVLCLVILTFPDSNISIRTSSSELWATRSLTLMIQLSQVLFTAISPGAEINEDMYL
jgi:hypothetical protein